MGYVLVATIEDEVKRIRLRGDEHIIGSDGGCDLVLEHPTVSRRHACLTRIGSTFHIEDLRSSNGTRIRGRRITSAELEPGMSLRLGAVSCVIEEIPDDDLEVGVAIGGADPTGISTPRSVETSMDGLGERFVLDVLPDIVAAREAGSSGTEIARRVAQIAYSCFPVYAVEMATTEDGLTGLGFSARRATSDEVFEVVLPAGSFSLRAEAPTEPAARLFERLVGSICRLIPADPALPAPDRSSPTTALLPNPPSVDPAMLEIYRTAARIADSSLPILILGESGVGKEVLAEYVHRASPRCSGPFLGLNCAALPDDLLESELFGIERGVATGVEARPGRFEAADGGTLLLDEIGDMALPTQAKILRVIQSGEVYRLGAKTPTTVKVRVLAATNHDIDAALRDGRFREDLFHRLAGWEVTIPPLRHRAADIPNLAAHFLDHETTALGSRVKGISRAALKALESYPWPGNVRELQREMAKAALFLADGEILDTTRLSTKIRSCAEDDADKGRLERALQRTERREIAAALADADSPKDAAELLGVSRATLYRRIKALGLHPAGN